MFISFQTHTGCPKSCCLIHQAYRPVIMMRWEWSRGLKLHVFRNYYTLNFFSQVVHPFYAYWQSFSTCRPYHWINKYDRTQVWPVIGDSLISNVVSTCYTRVSFDFFVCEDKFNLWNFESICFPSALVYYCRLLTDECNGWWRRTTRNWEMQPRKRGMKLFG